MLMKNKNNFFKLKWSDVVKKAEIMEHFEGYEVLEDKSQVPSYIALSRTHMHIFHVVENQVMQKNVELYKVNMIL